jgi:hypothetical protein
MVNQFFLTCNTPIEAPTQLAIAHPDLVETFQPSNRSVTAVAERRSRSGRDVQRANGPFFQLPSPAPRTLEIPQKM